MNSKRPIDCSALLHLSTKYFTLFLERSEAQGNIPLLLAAPCEGFYGHLLCSATFSYEGILSYTPFLKGRTAFNAFNVLLSQTIPEMEHRWSKNDYGIRIKRISVSQINAFSTALISQRILRFKFIDLYY